MSIQTLRLMYVRQPDPRSPTETVTETRHAAALLAAVLGCEPVEVMGILCLTTRLGVIGYQEVSRGSLNRVVVQPRETFQAAILANAAAIVVGHNHPSGDPTPSPEDYRLTTRLYEAGAMLGIELLDHVIVTGSERFYSFRDAGLLRQGGHHDHPHRAE